ncbi:PadR family transcriptional regulator [Janibacter sp. DB-40]|uniref:PadR family transcriptional regulator n=1 Tax=Janibacter sp. DB-40 TaxID=3028808 RepID=UPI002405C610|nr:PadR family transcriptional regulator [Janibacter sp. DB-40]
MRRRDMLEFAVLGLLHESPLHGYELRRRLNSRLGPFRALSFGTLYPCLAGLQGRGLVSVDREEPATGRRQRITYTLTDEGRATFAALADRSDPGSWEDEAFDVRLAFFARTEREVRLRILEGRRARLAERLAAMRGEDPAGEGADRWTNALRTHGEDSTERALVWIEDLIESERQAPRVRPGSLSDPGHPAFNPPRTQSPTKENP